MGDAADDMDIDSENHEDQQNEAYDADISRLSNILVDNESDSQDLPHPDQSISEEQQAYLQTSKDSPSQQLVVPGPDQSLIDSNEPRHTIVENISLQDAQPRSVSEHDRINLGEQDQASNNTSNHAEEAQVVPTLGGSQSPSNSDNIPHDAQGGQAVSNASPTDIQQGNNSSVANIGPSGALPAPPSDVLLTHNSMIAQPASEEHLPQLSRPNFESSSAPNAMAMPEAPSTPQSSQSAGDAAIFEKLLRDMTATDEHKAVYSPKFHGLGTFSPMRNPPSTTPSISAATTPTKPNARQSSEGLSLKSPTKSQAYARNSPTAPSRTTPPKGQAQSPAGTSLITPSQGQMQLTSPTVNSPSGWETVGSDDEEEFVEAASSPQAEIAQDSWVTIESEGVTSPANTQPLEQDRNPPQVEVVEAHLASTPLNPSPAHSQRAERIEDQDVSGDVEYPKLSLASSFSTHVSDHGRQPDFAYDDSTNMGLDGAAELQDGQNATAELELPLQITNMEETTFAQEAESDDELPTLKELCSQQSIKQEKPTQSYSTREDYVESPNDTDKLPDDEDVEAPGFRSRRMEEAEMPDGTEESSDEEESEESETSEEEEPKESEESDNSDQQSTPKATMKASQSPRLPAPASQKPASHSNGGSLAPPPQTSQSQSQSQKVRPSSTQVISLLSSDNDSDSNEADDGVLGIDGVPYMKGIKTERGWVAKRDERVAAEHWRRTQSFLSGVS